MKARVRLSHPVAARFRHINVVQSNPWHVPCGVRRHCGSDRDTEAARCWAARARSRHLRASESHADRGSALSGCLPTTPRPGGPSECRIFKLHHDDGQQPPGGPGPPSSLRVSSIMIRAYVATRLTKYDDTSESQPKLPSGSVARDPGFRRPSNAPATQAARLRLALAVT